MLTGRIQILQTEVYSSYWTLTHDPANFEKADEFLPERWLEEDSEDVKDASQPFSLGSRACLGRKYDHFFSLFLNRGWGKKMAESDSRLIVLR